MEYVLFQAVDFFQTQETTLKATKAGPKMLSRLRSIPTKVVAWMRQHPIGAFSTTLGLLTFGIGVNDFRQTVVADPTFKPRDSANLGRFLQRLHTRALLEDVSFLTLRKSADRCAELDYVYREACRKKSVYTQANPEYPVAEIELEISKEYADFASRMYRRALLRNGYVGYWFTCVLQDEAIRYLFLPLVAFIGGNVIRAVLSSKVK